MKAILLLTLCACFSLSAFGGITDEFITVWQTDNTGLSNTDEIRFYGEGSGYTLIWEEVGNSANTDTLTAGVINAGDYQLVSFPAAGTYKVRVDPTAGGTFINFKPAEDKQKLIEIAQWGTTQWTDLAGAFRSCYNLDVTASDAPDLTGVTSLSETFAFCYELVGTSAFNNWQTDSVTDMSGMFWSATQFNQDLNNWNTSNVTTMFNMFESANQFNGNISTWNTTQVTDMGSMFKSADSFNQPLNGWNTGAVTDMSSMFENALSFNQPIGNWNVSSVTTMQYMFKGASAFNAPIANWTPTSVTNMSSMFENASSFNQPIGSWNVSSVITMQYMFKGASAFNSSLANWAPTSVTNMTSMFENASSFNQPIGNWNVSSVTSMDYMFKGASTFNSSLANWAPTSVTNMTSMFENTSSFNQPIGSWNVSSVTSMGYMFKGASAFNQPLANWNMSSVTQIMAMFENASSFNQDISSWNLASINPGDAYAFLNNSGMDCINYSLLLNSLANNTGIPSNVFLGALNIIYDSTASAAHDYLTNTKGWILDGDSYVADCNTALPLTFSHFDAQYQEPFAVLTWQGDNEGDVLFYEVEQSFDGAQFHDLQKLAKQSDDNTYTYRHIQKEAVAYYRIKMVGIDGKASYSVTRSLRTSPVAHHSLTLYPNPAAGSTLHLDATKAMQVELFNQQGKPLGKYHLEAGKNSIDIRALAPGLYLLRHAESSQKLIIKR